MFKRFISAMAFVVATATVGSQIALAYDAKPVIVSAKAVQVMVGGHKVLKMTVTAKSPTPVNWLNASLEGPRGNIFGGGSGASFTKVGPDLYQNEMTENVSEWAPSGQYSFKNISVRNDAQLGSDDYHGDLSVQVKNTKVAAKPVISSIKVNSLGNGKYEVLVEAKSNAPVNWINMSLDGPNKNIFGGGSGATFSKKADDTWAYREVIDISPYGSSGKYILSGISVRNEGALESDVHDKIAINVTNTKKGTAPVITSVKISPTILPASGGTLTVTIEARSDAPVNWINSSLYGPNGNIFGGGSRATFEDKGAGLYSYTIRENISANAPSGDYHFIGLSVQNAAYIESLPYFGILTARKLSSDSKDERINGTLYRAVTEGSSAKTGQFEGNSSEAGSAQ
jgi:hypothetical protein